MTAEALAHRLVALVVAPAVASGVVLAVAGVGPRVWVPQALAVAIVCGIGLTGSRIAALFDHGRSMSSAPRLATVVAGLALACLAATLLIATPPPRRWLSIGPLLLYAAPVVLPALLLAREAMQRAAVPAFHLGDMAVVGAGLVLALQPDAAQAVALLAATLVGDRSRAWRSRVVSVCLLVISTASAVTRPDPLQPVAHVEGVFRLAFTHSLAAGLLVATGAVVLVVGAWASVSPAVAIYWAVLYACALPGLTPAPLIGFGAGPWLGLGCALALAPSSRQTRQS